VKTREEVVMTEPSGILFRDAATVFVVRDVGESVAHYRDVLGFHVEFTYGEPAFYAGVERGEVSIHLQAATDTERQTGQAAIYIFVTAVDALYEELRSRGALVLGEPNDYSYGMRDFAIRDPDGNQLVFGMETMTQGA
jgi:uncharacterized glyoxalase superfamily protein PhnB